MQKPEHRGAEPGPRIAGLGGRELRERCVAAHLGGGEHAAPGAPAEARHEAVHAGRLCGIASDQGGPASAVGEELPELKGKLDGIAMRVPVPNVSVVDLAVLVDKKTSAEEVNGAFRDASDAALNGILQYMTEPLVSIDFRGNSHSSIVDSAFTKVLDGDFVKVMSWYDI